MEREEFYANRIILIVIASVVCLGSIVVYMQTDLPIWIIPVVFAIAIFIVYSSLKTKLIIEDGILRYEKLGGGDEVALEMVSQIVTREIETIVNTDVEHRQVQGAPNSGLKVGKIRINDNQQHVNQERKVEKVIYILDGSGRTFFSIPANTIGFKQRNRFREAVKAINPNIDVF